MKHILSTLLLGASLCATAQISEYEHPCTIMAQEDVAIAKGEAFSPSIESLIIHDVDDNQYNPFSLELLKGENYQIKDGKIVPDRNFEGVLIVNVQVNDGKFDSNIFPFKVEVGNCAPKLDGAIYVAPNGNDRNSGSEAQPIKTLQRAKELVAERGATVVLFREGEYFMNKSVSFTAEDSGSEGAPVLYTAYPGESVRFTGSVALPYAEFDKPSPEQVARIENPYVKAKIKVIDLKEMGITDYGELDHVGYGVRNQPTPASRLFIDGTAMQLARYPNVGNYDDVSDHEGSIAFKSKSGIVHTWEQTGDLWVDGSLSKAWEWQKNKIASVEADSTVRMTWNFHSEIGVQDIKMFYFNIFEELDFPEEYFIDRENGLLYVFFPSIVSDKSDIRLTQSPESFIELAGVEYVTFKNITFEGSRNTAIETTEPSSFNTFDQCTIYACGLEGININGYGNTIKNTLIHNVGAYAIRLNGGDYATMKPAGNLVDNCILHDFSQERRAYNAGLAFNGLGQVARHIELYNGPHMAARISGVNHILEYCDFHEAPHEYSDMLGVYFCTGSDFFSRGTIVRRNKFHDVSGTWKQSAGVYMDNETNGVVVEENYIYDNVAEDNGWSVMIHGGGDNVVRRNVFVDCNFPFFISTRLNGYASASFEGILKRWEQQAQKGMNKTWERAYPELRRYFDDTRKRPSYAKLAYNLKYDKEGNITNYWNMRTPTTNVFKDNLVYNTEKTPFVMPETDPEKNTYNRGFYTVMNFRVIDGKPQDGLIHSNNHHVLTDPGFVDYKEHKLQVKESAEIAKKLPHLTDGYYNKMGTKTPSNQIGAK